MSTRFDIKCGRGAISPGEKCTKGTGSRVRTAAKIALGAGIGAAALATPSFMSGKRIGHLTHGYKANPGMAGGLANAAVPAVVGAVAGGALTAGALALKHRSNVYRQRSVNEDYAHQQAMKALDKKKNLSEEEFFDYYNRAYDKALKDPTRPHPEQGGHPHSYSVPVYAAARTRRPRTDAAGRRCGQGYIAANKQCQQKGAFPTRKAIALGLAGAGLTAGAIALHRRRTQITPVNVSVVPPGSGPSLPRLRGSSPSIRAALPGDRTTRVLPGDRTTRRITGTTPYGLLPPRPPKSKTQRMQENTAAAVRNAERDIGRAVRAEITRAGAVGNAMASAGEATGMAAKSRFREVRLRIEAARRRWEPGYRSARAQQPRPQPQPPEGVPRVQAPFQPPFSVPPSREAVPINRRPRRRRPQGFGRTDSLWATGFNA